MIQNKFDEFLNLKAFEICDQNELNHQNIDLTISFIFEEFNQFCRAQNYSFELNEFHQSILQTKAKNFLYCEIENLKNINDKNLMSKIDELRKKVVSDIAKFKQNPYKFNIEKHFNLDQTEFYKYE